MRKAVWLAFGPMLALTACVTVNQPPQPVAAHPLHAPYHAAILTRDMLQLFSGSPDGLATSGGPLNRNPGQDLKGVTFVEHDAVTHSYLKASALE